MSDISSFWNVEEIQADWRADFGALKTGNDLQTAPFSVCLPTVWRDVTTLTTAATVGDGGDSDSELQMGSRLWLIRREKLTTRVAIKAEEYAKEALNWLKNDGVVSEILIAAQIVLPNRLNLIIRYLPPDGDWQESAFF
jgi:phage gp46-like protein